MPAPPSTTPSSPPVSGPAPTDRRTWGAGIALLALVATFGATIFTSIPALLIGDDTHTTKLIGTLVGSLLQDSVFVAMPLLIIGLVVGRLRRSDVGLRVPARPWRIVLMVAAAFVLYLLLSKGLGDLLNVGDQKDDLPDKLGAKDSLFSGIAIGLAVTVLAPIGEEFLLRGILFPGLRDSLARILPVWAAIAVAALLDGLVFGALHIGGSKAIFLPILALFGAILCLLYQFSGTLYANIALHATNNTVAIAVALGWSLLGGVALWVSAISIIALIALAARAVEARLPPPRPRVGLARPA